MHGAQDPVGYQTTKLHWCTVHGAHKSSRELATAAALARRMWGTYTIASQDDELIQTILNDRLSSVGVTSDEIFHVAVSESASDGEDTYCIC